MLQLKILIYNQEILYEEVKSSLTIKEKGGELEIYKIC